MVDVPTVGLQLKREFDVCATQSVEAVAPRGSVVKAFLSLVLQGAAGFSKPVAHGWQCHPKSGAVNVTSRTRHSTWVDVAPSHTDEDSTAAPEKNTNVRCSAMHFYHGPGVPGCVHTQDGTS